MAMTPQEAAAKGLGWVPENHSLYGTKGFVGYQDPGAVAATSPGLQQAGATNVQDQAKAAQTYSNTPGAAPTENTTNQGFQDVFRNTTLQRMSQDPTANLTRDTNPVIDQQAAVHERALDRGVAKYQDTRAEQLGPYQTGAIDQEVRGAYERAGESQAGFEAALAQQELMARRQEVASALQSGQIALESDQGRAAQKMLAELDAALRREGLGVQASLGGRDLDLRRDLGFGGLNLDAMRMLLSDNQFNTGLDADMAYKEALLNQNALGYLMGRY